MLSDSIKAYLSILLYNCFHVNVIIASIWVYVLVSTKERTILNLTLLLVVYWNLQLLNDAITVIRALKGISI